MQGPATLRGALVVLAVALLALAVAALYIHFREARFNTELQLRLSALERDLAALRARVRAPLPGEEGTTSPPPLGALPLTADQRQQRQKVKRSRSSGVYGGHEDALHLGGFIAGGAVDNGTISPNVFSYCLFELGIRSAVDVGCGSGHALLHLYERGLPRITCIEGSHEAVINTVLDTTKRGVRVVEHDFARGAYWPDGDSFDLCWSAEVLEHIGRNFIENYVPTFRRCAISIVTTSKWGGYHHVSVYDDLFWVNRFRLAGFVHADDLSKQVRLLARADYQRNSTAAGSTAHGYHLSRTALVFLNPAVGALPRHKHLFAGNGCIWGTETGLPCTEKPYKWFSEVDVVPEAYQPLVQCRLNKKSHIYSCDK